MAIANTTSPTEAASAVLEGIEQLIGRVHWVDTSYQVPTDTTPAIALASNSVAMSVRDGKSLVAAYWRLEHS